MSRLVNRRVVLAARPRGEPAPGDLRLEEAAVPALVRTLEGLDR